MTHWNKLKSLRTLTSTDNYIISTHPLGPEKTITPPILADAQRILHTKGKASRERGLRTGTDKLASCGLYTKVWISQDSTISNASILTLEELLRRNLKKIFQVCALMALIY